MDAYKCEAKRGPWQEETAIASFSQRGQSSSGDFGSGCGGGFGGNDNFGCGENVSDHVVLTTAVITGMVAEDGYNRFENY